MRTQSSPLNERALKRFEELLAEMPLAGRGEGFNDHALPRVVYQAKAAGIPVEEAINKIIATQVGAERDVEAEVRSTVERLYQVEGDSPASRRKPFDDYNASAAEKVVSESPGSVEKLREASPQKGLSEKCPAYFLPKLFEGNPLITLGTTNLQATTELVSALNGRVSKQNAGFEFVVPSPARKQYGLTKSDRPSRKCDDTTGARHYIVVEFDYTKKDDAAAIILHLAQFAPLVMVLDSGNRSLHAWYHCEDVPDVDVWEFFNYAVCLGADEALWKKSQWVRLPNAIREKTGKLQEVLYFDPSAKDREWNLGALPGRRVEFRSILNIPDDFNEDSNLLGNRFLTRGKCVIFVGPTGVGKSTMMVQAPVLFADGKPLFGIKPERPLRSLILQAENDQQELARMVGGVLDALNPTDQQREMIGNGVYYATLNGYERDWTAAAEPFVEQWKPDLIILDPLFAYFTGNVSDQKEVSSFLRKTVQPFLERNNVGCIINHHTNKPPTGKDKAQLSYGDFAYAGSGSAELANWARGVMVLKSTSERGLFELHIPKRWKQAGLVDDEGNVTDKVLVRHSDESIFWEPAGTPPPVVDPELEELAMGFLEAERDGVATIKKIASKIGRTERTVNRRFKDRNPLDIPAFGSREALRLHRELGKISNLLETEAAQKTRTE